MSNDGLTAAGANALLDKLGTDYPWIKMHVGVPGAAGTTNPATETTRKQATFAAASAGSMATNAQLAWTNVAGTETYTHYSMWTASTAGTCGHTGAVTANPVTAGDNFTINSGGLTVSFTLAA